MPKGIMTYNKIDSDWNVWIDHKRHFLSPYQVFGLLIEQDYYNACFEEGMSDIHLFNGQLKFSLIKEEIYKVDLPKSDLFLFR
jgi:hypothetical protein